MKKVICAGDIEKLAKQGKKTFYVNSESLVTPAAKDAAKVCGVEITCGEAPEECKEEEACAKPAEKTERVSGEITSDMIQTMIKSLLGSDLAGVLTGEASDKPYIAEYDESGVKLIRGNSAKMESFDTGTPHAKACSCETVGKADHSNIGAGFFGLDGSGFECELECEEVHYIIEGTLTVTINGKTYTAKAGDVFFLPSGVKIALGSPDKTRVFYITYPA